MRGGISIIPESPAFVPTKSAARRAVERFRQFTLKAEEISSQTSESVRFIDCGGDFERVLCPDCGGELDQAWWGQRMNAEHETGFPLVATKLPCCGKQRSLAELTYDWPQGFARFSVDARNPQIADLTKAQRAELGGILGCSVRVIHQRL